MTDVVITASSVAGTPDAFGTAGAAIAAGEVLAINSTGQLVLADANGGTGATDVLRVPVGIALNSAASGQPVGYAKLGRSVTVGAVLTAGTDYWLSGNPGKIAPRADVTAGMTPVVVGLASSTSVLKLVLVSSGVQI